MKLILLWRPVIGIMITLNESNNKELTVRYFYQDEDSLWHRNIHENGGDMEENIADTLKEVSQSSVMYEVNVYGEMAALFVSFVDEYENGAVEAFHVKKKFRNSDFLKKFWTIIKSHFKNDFLIGVYERNVPAIKHFEKQRFDMVKIDNYRGHRVFVYKVKK